VPLVRSHLTHDIVRNPYHRYPQGDQKSMNNDGLLWTLPCSSVIMA
jgi:hypothetical protein